MGRNVASRKGFAYSPALTSMSGTWTRDRLRAFISNPDSVAPGTQMELTATYESETLDDLLAFLEPCADGTALGESFVHPRAGEKR